MKQAVALRYDDASDPVPIVVSSGSGSLAAQIERAARDYGVPVIRDVPLAMALSELKVGDEIPEALYDAIAAILNELSSAARA